MNQYQFIQHTKQDYKAGLRNPKSDWPPKVRHSTLCIHNHFFLQKLTVGWVKQQCRINSHNFSSRFAYYLSKPPKRYINYHRIEVGKQLLSNAKLSGIPISTIGYEVGFSSASAFSMTFKNRTGKPPSQW